MKRKTTTATTIYAIKFAQVTFLPKIRSVSKIYDYTLIFQPLMFYIFCQIFTNNTYNHQTVEKSHFLQKVQIFAIV